MSARTRGWRGGNATGKSRTQRARRTHYRKRNRAGQSYGMMCLRNIEGRAEVLMVRKPVTYAFNEFLRGKYNNMGNELLCGIFNKFTSQEVRATLTLDFSHMWQMAFNKEHRRYSSKLSSFEYRFIRRDAGKQLCTMLRDHGGLEETIWEFPKGHQISGQETITDAALRELREETGVTEDDVNLLHDVRPYMESFVDQGVTYKNQYWYAVQRIGRQSVQPRLDFYNISQTQEVRDLRWVPLSQLCDISLNKCSREKTISMVPTMRAVLRQALRRGRHMV